MNRRMNASEMLAMKQRAEALGGALLSRGMIGNTVKLRFRCAAGHLWAQSQRQLEKGRWCMTCARASKNAEMKAASFARLQRVVRMRGGTILSPKFVDSRTALMLRCPEGHEWRAVPKDTLRGSWCRVCARAPRSALAEARRQAEFVHVRRFVRKQHGRILTPGPLVMAREVRVRCQKGHEWRTLPQHLLVEVWCQVCLEDQMIERAKQIAIANGGECLSTKVTNRQTKLEWRCGQGHQFHASEGTIRTGTWCAKCRSNVKGDIEKMRRIAADRGGLCLSARYLGSDIKLRWRCGRGHVWLAKPAPVLQGTWCPTCRHLNCGPSERWTLADMQQLAMERWGACLSKRYLGSSTPHRWQCARGHTWEARPTQLRWGHWCPVCSVRTAGTLEVMAALARSYGGKLLTKVRTNYRTPVEFACVRGHRFALLAVVAKSGAWCPVCRAVDQPKEPLDSSPRRRKRKPKSLLADHA